MLDAGTGLITTTAGVGNHGDLLVETWHGSLARLHGELIGWMFT